VPTRQKSRSSVVPASSELAPACGEQVLDDLHCGSAGENDDESIVSCKHSPKFDHPFATSEHVPENSKPGSQLANPLVIGMNMMSIFVVPVQANPESASNGTKDWHH
jgi:hypothetical protein